MRNETDPHEKTTLVVFYETQSGRKYLRSQTKEITEPTN